MAISAIDTPVTVAVSQSGIKGDNGTDGTDGVGFSAVRKSIIDNPLTYLYKKNQLVNRLKNFLDVSRAVGGSYTDIYGVVQSAGTDEPREEVDGWLITSDETHTFEITDNVPLLDNGFSCVLELGSYAGGAVSQSIITIPATSGDLFTIGTDGSDNFVATLQGSDTTTYSATTAISSSVSTRTPLIAIFDGDDLNLYINNSLAGTVNLPSGTTATLDLTNATINGNFTLNMFGLRFYDIIFNSSEIDYLSGA